MDVPPLDPRLLREPLVSEPFDAASPGCGKHLGPRGCCPATPTWAGLAYYPHTTQLWLAVTCDEHVAHLHAPRPMLERDHAEIRRRREQRALALAGKPYDRAQPLARGAAAHQLLARAIAHHTATT